MTTVFSRIIKGELPCDKVFENDRILAFKDIQPIAPVHILIVPKKEITNLQSLEEADLPLIAEIASIAQQLAEKFEVAESGYRFLTNNGPNAGQEIEHLHFHLIGGRYLGSLLR